MASDAFALGQEAFHRGDGIELNPYDNLDAQSDEWYEGWLAEQGVEIAAGWLCDD